MSLVDSKISKQYLVFSLIAVVVVFIIGNVIDQEQFPLTEDRYLTDLLFDVIPFIVILLGIRLILQYRFHGNHGIAWTLFTVAIICWYVAELNYDYDVEYSLEYVSTLTSDILWIVGYPFFFGFTIFYLLPFKKIISKKIILISVTVSLVFVVPALYVAFTDSEELDTISAFLYTIYPILDSIILIPSTIALVLFFKGKVNVLWTLVFLATVLDIFADTGFLLFAIDDSYYVGHPIDILYVWSYILYLFGAINTYNILKRVSK